MTSCFLRAGWIKRGMVVENIQIIRKDPSNRVQELLIRSRKPIKVAVGPFRNIINRYYGGEVLKSAMFTVSSPGDSFVFQGHGWGHGVGLCQEGAMWMSHHGKTYQEILSHYFPHTKLAQLQ
jgi:stage II sporulation protein D